MTCRICLGDDSDDQNNENPLVSPCKCMGSMTYIHINCLKEWLNSKEKKEPRCSQTTSSF